MTRGAGQTGVFWGSVVWGSYKSSERVNLPNGGSGNIPAFRFKGFRLKVWGLP
jgi:hypothetical protein